MSLYPWQIVDVTRKRFEGILDIVGVEIGTATGISALHLVREIPSISKLYTIDPWKHFDGGEFEAGQSQRYHDNNMAEAYVRNKAYMDRIEFCRMTSDEFFNANKNLVVDFVWIDGDHSYEQVKKDIMNAMNIIKDGGLIGGHDYKNGVGVKIAVDEIFKKFETGDDSTWWQILKK